MRPLSLRISAFGPYSGNVVIPMEKLGDKGLYLITGDTGAGKTTIFDAICFALFGEASGQSRDASMLRSKYALPETPTEVELSFSHMGNTYTVKRNPEYMRPAKKGGGETRQLPEAELTMPEGSVITKIKVVTSRIEEILGINREQFSQIAMLAQGDFLKLLLASTDDRIKIFRDLFKTHNYLTLQKNLDAAGKELYGQVQDGKKSISQYISGIQVDSDNVMSIEVEKAKKGELVLEDVTALLDRLTNEDSFQKQKLDEELKNVSLELEEVNKRLGSAKTLEMAKQSKEEAERKLKEEEPKLEELIKLFESARLSLEDKAEFERKAARIEADFSKYDRVVELKRDIEAIDSTVSELGKEADKCLCNRESKTQEALKLKKEQESFKDNGAEIERIKAEIVNVTKFEEETQELSGALGDYFQRKSVISEKQNLYNKENDDFTRLNDLYEKKEQVFRNAQAGILAKDLLEGMECPVCGSVHHPHLALLEEKIPTEKELENAKKNSEKARKIRNERAEELSGLVNSFKTIEDGLKKKTEKLIGKTDLEEASGAAADKLKELCDEKELLESKLKDLEKLEKRRKSVDKLIPKLENEISAIEIELTQIKEKLSASKAKKESEETETGSLLSGLSYETKKDAEKETRRLLSEARKLQNEYDAADKKLKDQKNYITELKTLIRENEKNISELKETDIEKDKKAQKDLKKRQDECIRQGEIVAGRLNNNERTRVCIISKASSMSETEKKLRWVKALSDTANGKLSGKDKIMLETYIQTTYFDRIIRRANLRLITMSSGQYELVRLKEADNVKSQSGLDLGVIDHYNGSQRSVRTLSGGESFMASLSLALGLSDEVQSSAGGIRIDTMFVDEGFGSLDPEALDMAYRALAGLIEGNRLVGIISHVADLKERIDRQIVVTKEKSGGSRIRIV
ncbi:MAG: SMC family ATPase [Butyrivibrio sp.]|nr:SMC family ATPase [Butyrivibrio sp.]